MTHRIGIVAHTKRKAAAEALEQQVEASHVHWDDGTLGVETSHRETWEWLANNNGGCPWLVVLEDDAVPISDFNNQLDQALDVAPTDIVSLYLGSGFPPQWQSRIRQAVGQADIAGASWIVGNHIHGVAICIKANLVNEMLTYTQACTGMAFDRAIAQWARDKQHPIAATYPSLVDHYDGPSLAKHPDGGTRNIPRKAYKVGTRNTWTQRAVTL